MIKKWTKTLAQRKEAEPLALERNVRMQSLFEHMSEGLAYCRIVYIDGQPVDFIFLAANAAFTRLTGLANVTGKRFTEVIPGIRESDPELLAMAWRVATSGQSEKLEAFVNATKVWLNLSVYSSEKDCFAV